MCGGIIQQRRFVPDCEKHLDVSKAIIHVAMDNRLL